MGLWGVGFELERIAKWSYFKSLLEPCNLLVLEFDNFNFYTPLSLSIPQHFGEVVTSFGLDIPLILNLQLGHIFL